jgi:hypothetical protein
LRSPHARVNSSTFSFRRFYSVQDDKFAEDIAVNIGADLIREPVTPASAALDLYFFRGR